MFKEQIAEKVWNRNFILLTLSNFLMCSAYYSLIATLPVYLSSDMHANKRLVGITLACYIVASVIVRPFSGFALDRRGRKAIFLASLLFYAILFNGYILAVTIFAVMVVRFFHGLTWGITTTSNSTIAIDLIPPGKRGQGIGYFALSTTLGMAFGPVIGSYIFQFGGYFAMFLGGSVIGFVSTFLAGMILYPKLIPAKAPVAFRWRTLFEPTTIIPALNLVFIMITYGGLLSFIALYGNEIGIGHASGFFLVYAIGVGFSRFTSGKILDRDGPRYVILGCLTLLIIGFPLLALVKNDWGFYSAAIILGVGNGVVFPTFQTMVNNMVPMNRRGAANSTLFTGVDIGMGSGMVIVGFIAQQFSISTAFLVCSGICVVGLVIFLTVTLKYYNRTVKRLNFLT
jgi:MFS family permease